jgi:hypothetical protein
MSVSVRISDQMLVFIVLLNLNLPVLILMESIPPPLFSLSLYLFGRAS